MWYAIIIFIVVFELVITIGATYFPNIIVSGLDYTTMASGATTSIGEAITNPLEMFTAIMTFSIEGAEIFGVIFILLDILLGICLIKLALEAISAIGELIPF